jgi:hypothetical protein
MLSEGESDDESDIETVAPAVPTQLEDFHFPGNMYEITPTTSHYISANPIG